MTNSDQTSAILSQPPEKLSGHDLVKYLIVHPEARGNFKWRTLRSCMWRDLLIAQPGFEDAAFSDEAASFHSAMKHLPGANMKHKRLAPLV